MTASEFLNQEAPGSHRDWKEGMKPSGPRKRGWVWFFIVVVLLTAAFTAYRLRARVQAQDSAKRAPAGPAAVSVAVAPVEQKDFPVYLKGLGSVAPFNTVTVRSRVDGQLVQVAFREGQFVHAGDLLAQIDPRPFQVALDQTQGQLAKDQSQLTAARLDLGRFEKLLQEGVISQQQFDAQKANVGQLEGAIRSDQAQIDNAKLQLVYSRIAAPLSGRVGLRLVDQGNMVRAADPNGLVMIAQMQPITVIFTIPEDSLPEVSQQMRKGQLLAEAYGRDDKVKLATGKLITVDNQIDPATGTLRLKAVFDNADLALWPNQFVNVRLLLSMRKGAIVVPSAAIQRGAQGTYTYVVRADRHVDARLVGVDFNDGSVSVISRGLAVGEQVVVDGQDKLQAGASVDVRSGSPSTSNPAPPQPGRTP